MLVKLKQFVLVLILVLTPLTYAIQSASALTTEQDLTPKSYTTTSGGTGGQPVKVMAVKDQTGRNNNAKAYLLLTTPKVVYDGTQVFNVPASIQKTTLTGMQLKVNFWVPTSGTQKWAWSIFNWKNQSWTLVGTATTTTAWTMLKFDIANPQQYVNDSNEIQVEVRSSDASGDAKIDYEAIHLSYDNAAPPVNTAVPTSTVAVIPTAVAAPTATWVVIPTNTAAPTPTTAVIPTDTILPTPTAVTLPTNTAVPTATLAIIPTDVTAPTATIVVPPANTAVPTITAVVLPTNTAAPTATAVVPPTNTVAPTATVIVLPTNTAAPTATAVVFPTNTAAPTATAAVSPTNTTVPSPTPTRLPPTPTFTPVPTQASGGNTFYVAQNGKNTNPGTQALPWLTIQKAADTLAAGGKVIVLSGNYPERVKVTHSGTANAVISFQADNGVVMQGFTIKADYISIKGFEITNTPNDDVDGAGVYVHGSYCDIENNYIHFATRSGILLQADPSNYAATSHCIVRDNRLYQNSQNGIDAQGNNHLIEGNEIWGSIQYHPKWVNPPSWVDADGIRFFGSGHILRKNYIHDILYGIPENKNPHIDCFQTWTDQNHIAGNNTVIEQNHCENAQAQSPEESGSGFMLQNSSGGLIIRNNIVNAFVNVYLANDTGVEIINNTLTSNLNLNTNFYPVGVSVTNSTGIVVKNNLFFNQPGHIVYVTGTAVSGGKNLVYRSDGKSIYTTGSYDHSGDLWNVNPDFLNPASGDYHLQAISPAIDTGLTLSDVSNDYNGNLRPEGKAFDIGAMESPKP